jgi:hypothetical protein
MEPEDWFPESMLGKRDPDDFQVIMDELASSQRGKRFKFEDVALLLLENQEIIEEKEKTILQGPENMQKDDIYKRIGVEDPEVMGWITNLVAKMASDMFEIELYDTDNENGALTLENMIKNRLLSIHKNMGKEFHKVFPDSDVARAEITNDRKMRRWMDANEQGFAPIGMAAIFEKVHHRRDRLKHDLKGNVLKGKKFRLETRSASRTYQWMERRNYEKYVESWVNVESNRTEPILATYGSSAGMADRFVAKIRESLGLGVDLWTFGTETVPYVLKMLLDQRMNIVYAIGEWVKKSYSILVFVSKLHEYGIIDHYETWNQVELEMLSLQQYLDAKKILDSSVSTPRRGSLRRDIEGIIQAWMLDSKEEHPEGGIWRLPIEVISHIISLMNRSHVLMVYGTHGKYMETTGEGYETFYNWMFRIPFPTWEADQLGLWSAFFMKDIGPLKIGRTRRIRRIQRLWNAEENKKIIGKSISTAITVAKAIENATGDKLNLWEHLQKIMITSKTLLMDNIDQLKLVNDELFKKFSTARYYEEIRRELIPIVQRASPTIAWNTDVRNFYDLLVFHMQEYILRFGIRTMKSAEELLNDDLVRLLKPLNRLPEDFETIPTEEIPDMLNTIVLDLINDVMYTEIRASVDALEAVLGIQYEIDEMLHQYAPGEYEKPERRYTASGRKIRNFLSSLFVY